MANKSKSHKPLVLGSNRVNDTEIHYYGIWDPARSDFSPPP